MLASCVSKPTKNTSYLRSPSSAPAFSKILKPLIDKWIKQDPRTLLEILPDLPEEHRKNFTFARTSTSLQKASYAHPRVIAFGHTGETIFTFNGDPKLGGYSSLEIADLDNRSRLNLYEVRFKNEPEVGSDEDYITLSKDEIYVDSDNIQISRSNPSKCMQCHGASYKSNDQSFRFASYIWTEYNRWPNMYGAKSDTFYTLNSKPMSSIIDKEMLRNYLEFRDTVKVSEAVQFQRYKTLIFGSFRTDPYRVGSEVPEVGLKKSETNSYRVYGGMPNTMLTFLITINYSRMISGFIQNERQFQEDNTKFIKKWYCDSDNLSIQYPVNLNRSKDILPFAREEWNVGVASYLTKNVNLSEHIRAAVLLSLKLKNPNWKFPNINYEEMLDPYPELLAQIPQEMLEYFKSYSSFEIYSLHPKSPSKLDLCTSMENR